ncbi:uncharacterized protein [Drosophila takahashii]|uniref:uncharacterized protein n=1 Tax=Drosophila takahashii TaxID=29030 RepID=UPI0038992753
MHQMVRHNYFRTEQATKVQATLAAVAGPNGTKSEQSCKAVSSQKAPETLKNLLLRSSVPIVSANPNQNQNPNPQRDHPSAGTMAPLKGQEVLKFHKHSYLENRLFDHRLVKDNLLDKWPTADMNEYNERKDHRNLMESYVPATVHFITPITSCLTIL